MADSLYAIRKLVFEEKQFTLGELKEALIWNYGKGLDQQSVQDLAQGILKEAENAGRQVDEKMTEAVVQSVLSMKLSKEKDQPVRRDPEQDPGST